jgi:hypothetical protein
MRRLEAVVLGVLLLVQPVAALAGEGAIRLSDNADTILIPDHSSLHFRAFGPENAVEFDGPIELTGTWYFGDNPYNDTNTPDLSLYFVPDKASLARLPRFATRGQPGDIFLTNPAAFLDAVVSREDRAKVQKKGAKYLSGKIDIWVDKFEAGIECDAPYFNARFLRVAKPPLRMALTGMPDEGC